MDYIQYNNEQEVNDLDVNYTTFNDLNANAYTRGFYSDVVLPQAPYICSRWRDINKSYVMDIERTNHPDHTSRFSYVRGSYYPYVSGHFPGKFIEPPMCSRDIIPEGMAPQRFYSEERLSPFFVMSQGILDYESMKNDTSICS